jgi:hypothetical protein
MRTKALIQQPDDALGRRNETFDRHAAALEDTREFIREMTLWMRRSNDARIAALNALTERIQRLNDESADSRRQIRMDTAAVLSMLDRLDGPNGPHRQG